MKKYFRIFYRIHPKYRWEVIACILKLTTSWIVSKFSHRPELWIFRERGNDARDNGYWMFRYMKEEHPDKDCIFVITEDSPDIDSLQKWKDSVVIEGSFKHYVRMWQAEYLLSTHMCCGFPFLVRNIRIIYRIVNYISPKKVVFLKHGVIKDDIIGYHASSFNNPDIIICGAKPEYDYIKEKYGYSAKTIKLTGLARFDQLHNYVINYKQVLLMPTWRHWFWEDNICFQNSEYYLQYKNLLTNRSLQAILEENNLTLIFYPHHEIQPYIEHFTNLQLPQQITIASKHQYDVQTLLKESALLITDYSSVFFDFAYMRKPQIYFQFDEEEYRMKHYAEGYFDYRDGFGMHTTDVEGLLDALNKNIEQNFVVEDKYKKKMAEYFPLHDVSNCERIYQEICKL